MCLDKKNGGQLCWDCVPVVFESPNSNVLQTFCTLSCSQVIGPFFRRLTGSSSFTRNSTQPLKMVTLEVSWLISFTRRYGCHNYHLLRPSDSGKVRAPAETSDGILGDRRGATQKRQVDIEIEHLGTLDIQSYLLRFGVLGRFSGSKYLLRRCLED